MDHFRNTENVFSDNHSLGISSELGMRAWRSRQGPSSVSLTDRSGSNIPSSFRSFMEENKDLCSQWKVERSFQTLQSLPSGYRNFIPPVAPQAPSRTLFVGDLSLACDEEKLFHIFHPFGNLEKIQLKRNEADPYKTHLSYGFVKFADPSDAARALQQLNGTFFLGRPLRLGWADDIPTSQQNRVKQFPVASSAPTSAFTRGPPLPTNRSSNNGQKTAQIHITYVTTNMSHPLPEFFLREVFSQFGDVVDVAIKKVVFNPEARIQSGYGFIHYPMTSDGIESAVTAVNRINQFHKVIGDVRLECALTHSLNTLLLSIRSQMPASMGIPSPPAGVGRVTQLRSVGSVNPPPPVDFHHEDLFFMSDTAATTTATSSTNREEGTAISQWSYPKDSSSVFGMSGVPLSREEVLNDRNVQPPLWSRTSPVPRIIPRTGSISPLSVSPTGTP